VTTLRTPPAPVTRNPRPKPARTVRWADVPAGGIVVRVGPVEDRYAVTEFDSPLGRAFHVQKLGPRGGAEYDVLLADDGHRCDCLGFEHTGSCRHVEALTALLAGRDRRQPPAAALPVPVNAVTVAA
jgi:hypothetical protein